MNPYPEHLVIAPIVVPLVAGALLLFFDDRRRWLKAAVSVVAAVVLLAVSILLLRVAHGRRGSGRGLFARQLAPALRHRAGARPTVGDDAGADGLACHPRADLFPRAVAQGRAPFPHTVSVPAHGAERCFPDRGLVQPLRLFRGDAGGIIRLGAARLGSVSCQRWHALHRDEPRRFAAVPDRRVAHLWRHRHAQHG